MLRARSRRFRRARIALWEAPITPTVVGWVLRGRVVIRSEGLRTVSRSNSWGLVGVFFLWFEGSGRGFVVGDAPVQRIRRSVRRENSFSSVSGLDGGWGLIWTVQVDVYNILVYYVG